MPRVAPACVVALALLAGVRQARAQTTWDLVNIYGSNTSTPSPLTLSLGAAGSISLFTNTAIHVAPPCPSISVGIGFIGECFSLISAQGFGDPASDTYRGIGVQQCSFGVILVGGCGGKEIGDAVYFAADPLWLDVSGLTGVTPLSFTLASIDAGGILVSPPTWQVYYPDTPGPSSTCDTSTPFGIGPTASGSGLAPNFTLAFNGYTCIELLPGTLDDFVLQSITTSDPIAGSPTAAVAPEPGTLALTMLGMFAMVGAVGRRRRTQS